MKTSTGENCTRCTWIKWHILVYSDCLSALYLLQESRWTTWCCSWLDWDTQSLTWPSVTPASCTCWWNWRPWSVSGGDGERAKQCYTVTVFKTVGDDKCYKLQAITLKWLKCLNANDLNPADNYRCQDRKSVLTVLMWCKHVKEPQGAEEEDVKEDRGGETGGREDEWGDRGGVGKGWRRRNERKWREVTERSEQVKTENIRDAVGEWSVKDLSAHKGFIFNVGFNSWLKKTKRSSVWTSSGPALVPLL